MIYQYIANDVVKKIDDDGLSRISCSIENAEFKSWLADGNVPLPLETPVYTFEDIRHALQSAIDTKAQSLGFSGGNALMLYAGFTNQFQSMASSFASWEASVWVQAGEYKAQVILGNKPMLNPSEAVALMPTYP